MAEHIDSGPVTPRELVELSLGLPPEIAGRIRRAADQLSATECPPSGAGRIYAERLHQVRAKGFHFDRDDTYTVQQLARAAAAYALPANTVHRIDAAAANDTPTLWPWPREAWKPGNLSDKQLGRLPIGERIRELEKAGALCAAEIDRLLRLQATGAQTV